MFADIAAVGNTVYFPANDGVLGEELWVSAGIASNTTPIADQVVNGDFVIRSMHRNGPRLYFSGNDGDVGFELWAYGFDADNDGLTDQEEAALSTGITDADSDDDGLCDAAEVSVPVGTACPPGSPTDTGTDPLDADTDDDGLLDGVEASVVALVEDPDGAGPLTGTEPDFFVPDADPSTATSPVAPDTDGDGVNDGLEDANHNGRIDPGESDPIDPESPVLMTVPVFPLWAFFMLIVGISILAGVGVSSTGFHRFK